MDKILVQLGELFLGALPSTILLAILVIYLKYVLFRPLERVMAERYSKTEGKQQQAAAMVNQAEAKAGEYAAAIQAAKSEIYGKQEALRKELEAERDRAVAEASARVKAEVEATRQRLQVELEAGRRTIDTEAAALAAMITDRLLERRTA